MLRELPDDVATVFAATGTKRHEHVVRLNQYLAHREEAVPDGEYRCPNAPTCRASCFCRAEGVLRILTGILERGRPARGRWTHAAATSRAGDQQKASEGVTFFPARPQAGAGRVRRRLSRGGSPARAPAAPPPVGAEDAPDSRRIP